MVVYYVCVRINYLPSIGSGSSVKLDYKKNMCLSTEKMQTLEPRSVGANNLGVYCDAALGIDVGYKSRTGIVVVYANGAISCKSSKQNIITKSSAEAELVALCNGVVMLMACRNILFGFGV